MTIRAFDACMKEPWAIIPDHLQMILEITERHMAGEKADLEAVAAKIGKPLDNNRSVEMRGDVAVIPVTGPIVRFADWFTQVSGLTSVESLALDFNAALNDDKVKAILLDIESPGGSVSGINDFARMIFNARSVKPVYSFAGDLMASAAYWFGAAAEKAFASPAARVGSIGVVTAIEDFRGAREKAGIKEFKFVSSQSPKKQADPATESGATEIQTMIDDLATIFINSVAEFRGTTPESVIENFGQGGVMVASKALEAGMIDGISSFEEVVKNLNERTEKTTGATRSTVTVGAKLNQEKKNMEQEDKKTEAKTQVIDLDFLNANHSDLVESIRAEGRKEGLEAGAKAERERIEALEDIAVAGHEDLLAEAKKDGSTAEVLAMRQCKAERTVRTKAVDDIAAGAPDPVKIETDAKPDPKPEGKQDDKDLTPEEKWDKLSAKEQLEYAGGKAGFLAYERAAAAGRVKILSK